MVKTIATPFFLTMLFQSTTRSSSDSSRSNPANHDSPLLPFNYEVLFARGYDKGWKTENQTRLDALRPKRIPRHVWIGRREKPNSTFELPEHIQEMANKSMKDGWQFNVLGNAEQLEFMETFWPGTSVLWAYKIIHKFLGNAACDIWRYAVLYTFGGLYMDDDSFLERPLEQIVGPDDTLIMTSEKNPFHDTCYVDSYHLSAHSMHKRFVNFTNWHSIYGNKAMVSWAIFSAPRELMNLRVLQNIVETIRAEYFRSPVVWMLITDWRWKIVMCTTGPQMLTATVRELYAETVTNASMTGSMFIRIVSKDFAEYGGEFKVGFSQNGRYNVDNNHYMVRMQKQHVPLLSDYVPFNVSLFENKAVSGAGAGKRIFLVQNGTTHLFPTFDTFTAMNFTVKDIIHIANITEFLTIPEGRPLPPLDA